MQLFEHEKAFIEALEGNYTKLKNLCPDNKFEERFNIYHTSILSTLQQALKKNFHPLEKLIGDGAFNELTYQYALKTIPTSFNLNQYGYDFSQFAKSIKIFDHLPYLPDFIDFCYLWQQVFISHESDKINISYDYPIYQIWERCQPEYTGNKQIKDWKGPFHYSIFKENGLVIIL